MDGNALRAIRLCGTEEVDPPGRLLKAGPLSAEFAAGALRYVRLGEVEVIRAIAFLVRDENWGTFTPAVSDLSVREDDERFVVTWHATCADAARTLVCDARIEGGSDGSLSFDVVAEPVTDVLTNRTGFVVLHPVEGVAGRPVRVLHVDGREIVATFPDLIDPVQPFHDIRALSHEVVPGLWATCRMEGDAFEMEDQRNWSDASYKTYVRPLALPWPYVLKKGERLAQSVRLTVSGALPAAAASGAGRPVTVEIGSACGQRMPAIGLGVPAEEADHALAIADLVRRMGPQELVCQFDVRRAHGRRELDLYRRLGEETGAAIVLETVIPGGMDPRAELEPIAALLRETGLSPAALSIFPAQDLKSVLPGAPWPEMPSAEAIIAAARSVFPGIRLGGGMFSYFTELNRKRPPAARLDYVTHTTCPIVHAADDRSVMETLESLPSIVKSTRAFIGTTPYRVGPSALGCRDNPYGQSTPPNPDNRRVCLTRADPRQRGLFNAAWTLGYIAAFARGGVEAVAMGAPTGPFGFIHRRTGQPQPWFDDRDAPALYPAWHVMAGLSCAAGKPLLTAGPARPGSVEALAYREGESTILWLANLTPAGQSIALAGREGQPLSASILDETGFERAAADPAALQAFEQKCAAPRLTLDAYAVARVRIG